MQMKKDFAHHRPTAAFPWTVASQPTLPLVYMLSMAPYFIEFIL